ncbi:MAG: EAL domain-containing protein, partial [Alphaproteobacteria bacterium]
MVWSEGTMAFWGTKAGWQAALIIVCGVVTFILAHMNDAYEQLQDFIEDHERYQLDEMVLVLIIVGLMSIVYAAARLWDFQVTEVQRDQADARSEWMSQHDALTGLLNRHALAERLENASSSADNFAMLVIDLDGFKKVNDVFGHKAGDFALQEIAERLREQVQADSSIFRFGGDEFVIMVKDDAEEVARNIVKAVAVPILFNGIELDIGASIGVAFFPSDAQDGDDCLARADAAMYHAKASGRGMVCVYDPSLQERQLVKTHLERDLRMALHNRTIKPFYQPVVDLQSGQISGFEALARWEKASGEFIPPSVFIPVAEEIGLIGQLSDQLLRQALIDAASWPDRVLLSFNISPAQLGERGLGLRILKILLEVGLPPSRLEIEITETALVKDLDIAAQILNDLHEGGVRIALDDFGTGYSSLAQLS